MKLFSPPSSTVILVFCYQI